MNSMTPPFGPVLLAGFALRPLPPFMLRPALDLAMAAIRRRHADVFERLDGLDPIFLIDPVDLPFVFRLRLDGTVPRLDALKNGDESGPEPTAVIRGSLLSLIALLEGRIDGDALFFSRDLAIEGDTGAVVALRNAVDGAEIDLIEDLVSNLGPFAGPSRRAIEAARSLFGKMAEDLETLRAAAIAPALRGGQASSAAICRLEKKMDKAAAGRRRAPGRAS